MRTRAWMAMLLLVLMWAPAACGAAGAAVVAPAAGATTTMSTSATLPAAAGDFTLTSPAVVESTISLLPSPLRSPMPGDVSTKPTGAW